jgi:hypothetical protein
MEKGAPYKGRFAKKRFALPQLPGLRLRRSLPRRSVALASEEGWGHRGSCPTAGLALADGVSKEGLRGASPGDSRSFANNPPSAPIAGDNKIPVVGLAMDNHLRLASENPRRVPGHHEATVTADIAHLPVIISSSMNPRRGAGWNIVRRAAILQL